VAGALLVRPPAGLALAALAGVLLLDLVQWSRPWPVVVVGLLDEPAHLATAWLVLAAVGSRVRPGLQRWALVGSVAIDLDHVPLYLGWDPIAAPVGRPVTHSLGVVAALAVLAAVPRLRRPALGLCLGVLLHLGRDLATGPGVPLLWPLSVTGYSVFYAVYWTALTVAALCAIGRGTRPVTDRAGAPAAARGNGRSRTVRSRFRAGSAGAPDGRDRRNTSSPSFQAPDESPRRGARMPADPPAEP
jgi:inner membrane protein